MLPISRILVPVDFSGRCLEMMPYVKTIAIKYGAEVALIHVAIPYHMIYPTGISDPIVIPTSYESIEELRKQMESFAVDELKGIPVRRLVYEGDTIDRIISFAKTEGVNLIAMPTRGYGTFRRMLIGSVTSKILHDALCPVLTGAHIGEMPVPEEPQFSNILCAVDLGPQSQSALAWAHQFATDHHAKLSIIHVITTDNLGIAFPSSTDFRLELESTALKSVAKLQRDVGVESAAAHVQAGVPSRAICAHAESLGADLLIIGRGPLDGDNGRLPTNAYAIIRQSPCPVVSV